MDYEESFAKWGIVKLNFCKFYKISGRKISVTSSIVLETFWNRSNNVTYLVVEKPVRILLTLKFLFFNAPVNYSYIWVRRSFNPT